MTSIILKIPNEEHKKAKIFATKKEMFTYEYMIQAIIKENRRNEKNGL
jgi:hypothetical protein